MFAEIHQNDKNACIHTVLDLGEFPPNDYVAIKKKALEVIGKYFADILIVINNAK